MVKFDAPHVFRKFGGPRGLLDYIEKQFPGEAPTYNQVQMWSQRRKISAEWVGCVLYCVLRKGWGCEEFLIDANDFLSPDARPRC